MKFDIRIIYIWKYINNQKCYVNHCNDAIVLAITVYPPIKRAVMNKYMFPLYAYNKKLNF